MVSHEYFRAGGRVLLEMPDDSRRYDVGSLDIGQMSSIFDDAQLRAGNSVHDLG